MPTPSRSAFQPLALLWQRLSHLGVEAQADGPLPRRVILSNQVAAVVFVLGVGVSLYFLTGESSGITFNWFVFLLSMVAVMPVLNAFGFTSLSRHILSSLMPLFIVAIVAHARITTPDEVHGASFYIPRFFLMAISFMPLLLFAPSERWRMYVSFGFNMATLLFYNELMEFFGAGMGVLEPTVKDAFFISVSSMLALGIVASGFFFLNQLNHAYELRIGELLKDTARKNKRINRAINYASNIQQVVMPTADVIARLGHRMFIVYRPLDVVSGDFYFLEQRDSRILFTVIDCTGHGVPGAFVSILAYNALQRSVSQHGIQSPAAIVAQLNRHFHEDIGRSGNPHIRDGMDIAICSFDTDTRQLRIAGANLTAHVAHQGQITAHPCDRGYIAQGDPDRTFTETVLDLAAGDMVYLSSDGFSDQFGGPSDKRLGRRRLAVELNRLASLPLAEQESVIISFFDEWKGSAPQVDDVCLIGFRA